MASPSKSNSIFNIFLILSQRERQRSALLAFCESNPPIIQTPLTKGQWSKRHFNVMTPSRLLIKLLLCVPKVFLCPSHHITGRYSSRSYIIFSSNHQPIIHYDTYCRDMNGPKLFRTKVVSFYCGMIHGCCRKMRALLPLLLIRFNFNSSMDK